MTSAEPLPGAAMHPSPAELARTLTRGRLPGVLRWAHQPAAIPVHHATDHAGQPLILVRDDSEFGRRAAADPAVALTVRDRPPLPDSPRWGRVLLSGHVRPVDPETAADRALLFAESNPVGDLLDLGLGCSLYVIDVNRIRLFDRTGTTDIDPTAYLLAEPDPLHEDERDLLLDLADHHLPQITTYFRGLLDSANVTYGANLRPARLDRHGFLVNLDAASGRARFVRLRFGQPVHCRHDLARLLHPVLCQCDRHHLNHHLNHQLDHQRNRHPHDEDLGPNPGGSGG